MPSAASRRLEPRLATPRVNRNTRRTGDRPPLAQFVLLSLLLHAFFILLFGSPTGGSPEGRATWGRLDVTIRGPLLDTGIGREAITRPLPQLPGTEILDKRERRRDAAKAAPAKPPEPPAAQPDLEAPKVSEVPVPAPLERIAPVAPPVAELAPSPRIDPVQSDVPVIAVPAIEWTPREAAEPALVPPVEIARPRPMPVIPTTTLEASGAPAVTPSLAPPVEIAPLPRPTPLPVLPAPALQEQGLPALAPSLAPPVEIAVPPKPVELPTISAPALPQVQVPVASPAIAPPVEVAPVRPAAPAFAAPPPGSPAAREIATPSSRDAESPARDSPIFNNRRQPSSDAPVPGTGPRIDLEAAKARARQVAREGSGNRALLPFPMPPAPERKTREQVAIEKAWKPDCKDAYKDMGLLAVVPLIANEFGEGNCRW